MKIQGKRVWIAGQFMAAQMEIEDGTIKRIDGYGTGPADQVLDEGTSGFY